MIINQFQLNKYYFIFFYLAISACNETTRYEKTEADSIVIVPERIDTISRTLNATEKQPEVSSVADCDEALNLMFQTSNYQPEAKLYLSDYRIHVSEPGDSINPSLGIRIYHTHNHDSALMGILNLDLQTGKLLDLSPYLDNPKELTYDSIWLEIIRKNCSQLPAEFY